MAQLQFMLFEAFSNVLQHAKASTLRILAHPCEAPIRGVRLQIIDDGCGFDPATQPPDEHVGLRIIRDTIRVTGGTLDISSRVGHGTSIVVSI